ncbi:MAG: lipopolysaccharide biosynthesis protein [Planctomycetota bacterium]
MKLFGTDHLVADLKNRSVRGSVASMGTQGVKLVLQMGSTMVLARLLTPDDYGIFGMAIVVTGFLALFNDLGLSMATIQRREITHGQVTALFWVNAALGFVIMLAALAAAPVTAWFFGEPGLKGVVAALAVAFLCGGLAVQHQALLRRQMRYGRIALLEVTALVVGVAVGIGCAWRGMGYWSLVAMHLAVTATSLVGAWTLCRWVPGRPRRAENVNALLGFGANLFGFNLVNYFSRSADSLLLGWRWGAQPLGFYANARRLMQLPLTQLNAPMTQVAIPALSRVADQAARYRAAYLRFVDKILLLALPGIAFLIATSDWLVAVLLGPQWGESAHLLAILGVGALLEPLGSTTGWLLISQGRTREMLRLALVDAPLRFGLVAAALPWGASGVAVAVAVRTFVYFPLLCLVVGRKGPVRARDICKPAVAPALAAAGVLAALLAFRTWVVFSAPLAALAASLAVAMAVALTILVALPAGRGALTDLRDSLVQMVQGGKNAPPRGA